MRVEPLSAEAFTIYDAHNLDPVNVFMRDLGGQGQLVIECYGWAWSAWWGAIGNSSLRSFVRTCGTDYVVNRLITGQRQQSQRSRAQEEKYLSRIVRAVQDALADNTLAERTAP